MDVINSKFATCFVIDHRCGIIIECPTDKCLVFWCFKFTFWKKDNFTFIH